MDINERVVQCEVRIENIEGYQKKQNGHLEKIDTRLHSLHIWIMSTLVTVIISVVINLLK